MHIVFQEALQGGFLKRLGDVATVLLDLVSVCSVSSCHSRQTDDDQIRGLIYKMLRRNHPKFVLRSFRKSA